MSKATEPRLAPRGLDGRSLSTATRANAAAMVVAAGAIIWQIAAGVDYPTVPPGPIILGVATIVVLTVRATWAKVLGVVMPLFLVVGGTIAPIANEDNAWRHPDELSPFLATVLQMTAVVVALIAGVAAWRERRL